MREKNRLRKNSRL